METSSAIPAAEAARIAEWVAEQFSADVRGQVFLEARFSGSDADIVERRLPEDTPAAPVEEWDALPVARLRRLDTGWRLYFAADGSFHLYEPLPEAGSLDELFNEVDEDPYNLFWG